MKDGDPQSVRHLRPDHMPGSGSASAIVAHATEPQDDAEGAEVFMEHTYKMLQALAEPFPPELIEHLPKQKWKGAWKDQPYQNCDECGGYHPLGRPTLHLDYVGHAGTTKRLLEVDPLWEWEPLSYDENGLPRFDKFGGLWIKLTVCGVTRLGYGDAAGKDASSTAVKEIIGDAIRNAAMRFGVALDLWSKVDQHAGKNPGAIDDERPRQTSRNKRNTDKESSRGDATAAQHTPDPARAANQDALDELLGICDRHGLDTREVEERYNREFGPPELVKANGDDIRNFGAILISEQEPSGGDAGAGADSSAAGAGSGDQPGGVPAADGTPYEDTRGPDDDAPMF
jgi:hypothetical protein